MKKRASSSIEIALNDEDLLTLILLRVPFTQLLLLKSVLKKWLSLITNPHFSNLLRHFLPPLRASSLLIQRTLHRICPHRMLNEVFSIPLDNPNAASPFRNSTFAPGQRYDPQHIHLQQSCNGLALCTTSRLRPGGNFQVSKML